MIDFEQDEDHLLLVYTPEAFQSLAWLHQRFRAGESIHLRHTFTLRNNDLLEPLIFSPTSTSTLTGLTVPEEEAEPISTLDGTPEDIEWEYRDNYHFIFGNRDGDYFHLKREVLGTKSEFYVSAFMKITLQLFVAHRDISVLCRIDEASSGDVFIGGDHSDCIPEPAYRDLIRRFPTSTVVTHYARARVAACVREFLDLPRDFVAAYNRYMNRRAPGPESEILRSVAPAEINKYQAILDHLRDMLDKEFEYSERVWQRKILSIVQLLYPKYIHVLENVRITDTLTSTHRDLDLMLVDVCGNVDLIEIKKPFEDCLMTPGQYRGNHIPVRELAGSIMQLEKYILLLNRWGRDGERVLSERYGTSLPSGMQLRIINPRGFIIMGREVTNPAQRADFEVVRRKYRSVADIITYDDLIGRIEYVVSRFESVSSAPERESPVAPG